MRSLVEGQSWQFNHGIQQAYVHGALAFAGKAGQRLWRLVRSR
jgi:hypothetical protein